MPVVRKVYVFQRLQQHFLGQEGVQIALHKLGIRVDQAYEYAQQTPVIKKVYVFQHLQQHFLGRLGSAFQSQTYHNGDKITMLGEIGHHSMSLRVAS